MRFRLVEDSLFRSVQHYFGDTRQRNSNPRGSGNSITGEQEHHLQGRHRGSKQSVTPQLHGKIHTKTFHDVEKIIRTETSKRGIDPQLVADVLMNLAKQEKVQQIQRQIKHDAMKEVEAVEFVNNLAKKLLAQYPEMLAKNSEDALNND